MKRPPRSDAVTITFDVHFDGTNACIVKPETVTVRDGDHLHIMQPVELRWMHSDKPVVLRREDKP
jgi:hypothetical protein